MKKAPNDVDRQVGGRVRLRRLMIGMSQEKLGNALGLTFQQVQKYEKGTNRISASRLQQIASVLGVTINQLYETDDAGQAGGSGFAEAGASYQADLLTADGLRLLRGFHAIPDPKVRRRVLDLVAALAGSEHGPSAPSERSE